MYEVSMQFWTASFGAVKGNTVLTLYDAINGNLQKLLLLTT